MSIVAAELIAYGPASQPTDDTSTSGGAIDALTRPVFTQFTANAKLALISDGADTRSVDVVGRDATGAVVSETIVLTGATEVLSVATFERIQSVKAQTTSGTRIVTAKQGSAGATIGTIPLSEKGFYMMFRNAASAGTSKLRYEKLFWKNTNATLTLNSAQVTLTADPSTKITLALAASKNDSGSVANRLTSPGLTFVGVGVAQAVPGNTLEAASAIGTWILQTLGINDPALKSSFTTQLDGTTV